MSVCLFVCSLCQRLPRAVQRTIEQTSVVAGIETQRFLIKADAVSDQCVGVGVGVCDLVRLSIVPKKGRFVSARIRLECRRMVRQLGSNRRLRSKCPRFSELHTLTSSPET